MPPSPPTMLSPAPVPARIVREIADALLALNGVGCVLETDPATAQAGRSEAWQGAIESAIRGGLYAVEMSVGPSVEAMPETAGASKLAGVEIYDMDVALVAHLPEPLPTDPGAAVTDPPTTYTPARVAADFFARVFALAAPTGTTAPDTQCGRWLEFAGTGTAGPALALHTDVVGGGAAALSEMGTRITGVGLTVRYRVQRGNMGVAG